MEHGNSACTRSGRVQFGLAELFEHLTVCAVPLAFSPALGVGSSILLMAMGLALGFRQGLLALILVMVASVAADLPASSIETETSLGRQLTVGMLAAALCGWYKLRRQVVWRSGRL